MSIRDVEVLQEYFQKFTLGFERHKFQSAIAATEPWHIEGIFTVLLAWFVFCENFDRRIALGMLAIVVRAVVLSWPGEARFAGLWPALCILAACFAWALDNNLTRKVSLTDATWIAAVKGLTRLRCQPGPVRRRLASPRYGTHRGLFLGSALLRYHTGATHGRGTDAAVAGGRRTHGIWRMVAFDRTAYTRTRSSCDVAYAHPCT